MFMGWEESPSGHRRAAEPREQAGDALGGLLRGQAARDGHRGALLPAHEHPQHGVRPEAPRGRALRGPRGAGRDRPAALQGRGGPRGGCQVEVQHMGEPAQFTVERVVAMLLTELVGIAEGEMGGAKVTDCVVSIPAYFTDKQRASMLDATRIAGLNCLRLMHETTATALAYGIYKTELPEKDPITV